MTLYRVFAENFFNVNNIAKILTFKIFFVFMEHGFGQDEYSRLSRNASLGVHGYILVFSIVSRQSFEMIHHVNDLLFNTLGDAPDVPRVLVGCMKDLAAQRQVNEMVRIKLPFVGKAVTCLFI